MRPTLSALPVLLALLAACSTAPRTLKDRMEEALEERRESFETCYKLQLEKNPKLTGKVETEFTIDRQGRVTQATVLKSTLGSVTAENCILATIRSIQFPKGEATTMSNPFTFRSAD